MAETSAPQDKAIKPSEVKTKDEDTSVVAPQKSYFFPHLGKSSLGTSPEDALAKITNSSDN